MRKALLFSGLVAVLLLTSGCALTSAGRRGAAPARPESSEIARLKAQITELQRRVAVADVEIGRLQRRLAELESGVSGQARAKPPETRPMSSAPAPGRSGSTDPAPAGQPTPAEIEASDLPEVPGTEARPGVQGPASAAVEASSALTASAQALYDRGYTLFHRGLFVDSETAFQQFLRGYSETVLGDNAQFWIAEARFARGDISGALAAYRETAYRFPDGNKAPDALLKAGDCLLALGDGEAARRSFRQILDDFPGSTAAATARERLALSQ